MGRRGPAPRPTALKLLHGVDKHNPGRVNRDEPRPDEADIAPPAWLSPSALEVWDTVADDLIAKGVLTAWDVEALANWCDAVARRRDAAAHVEDEGAVIEQDVFNKNGDVSGSRLAKSPWLLALDAADAQVRYYGARFGLTPSDRSQLSIGGADTGLGAERLLS
jgi:P27 family predicted phage terminase small subunit